ncbi:MAG: polysaccharide pyruvyl transferase family protein [Bacillota bacterium]|nr:polysaccharide pyruvyl transferase family protein [Bacillota bacterium]
MKKRVAIISACDRHNYGDMLFPLVLERLLRASLPEVSLEYYGLVNSDLSRHGGKPTKSLQGLAHDPERESNLILLVAGGEVLDATWTDMLLNLVSNPVVRPLYHLGLAVARRIGVPKATDWLSRSLLGSCRRFPWVISANDFPSIQHVIYNAVGGVGLRVFSAEDRQFVAEQLRHASYLSVRDRETERVLGLLGVKADVVPDSAILVSEVFPLEKLRLQMKEHSWELLNAFPNGYICFQSGRNHVLGYEPMIADQLAKLSRRLDLGVVLLPLGRAPEHEDHVALRRIQRLMPRKTPVALQSSANVIDVMSAIAGAKAFAGTSLHGCITAMSYGIPHIGLTHGIAKLKAFLSTWSVPELAECVSYDTLSDGVTTALQVPSEKLNLRRNELIHMGRENIERVAAVIGV